MYKQLMLYYSAIALQSAYIAHSSSNIAMLRLPGYSQKSLFFSSEAADGKEK